MERDTICMNRLQEGYLKVLYGLQMQMVWYRFNVHKSRKNARFNPLDFEGFT